MDQHVPKLHKKVKVRRGTETVEVEVTAFTEDGTTFEGKRADSDFPDETPFRFDDVVGAEPDYAFDGCSDGLPGGFQISLEDLEIEERRRSGL